ncbi:hypothetical protein [Streptomyces antarcticus]|uniref:hypothetical protein n=1 Tax=Streptomyces antarcticus TaxID=2996458 RepID=UPI00226EF666|nr:MULTISPECIES: hypothetical protein [unclassified Streptomyces]MCY0944795.1 hypothetical protein [Streptomyces sp. H34-AA3]MCZ4081171.1 hypothetical protein [Streptomyces sp. H34-S5]
MSVDNTLIVPVEVAALAVNRRTRDTGTPHVFHRWITNFKDIGEGVPPEPAPFSSPEEWTGREDRLGVYLQWELPAALTRGRHDEEEGVGDFPLVPNRWLVVRHTDSTRALKAWIVESDYLDPMDGTVSFQDPGSDEPAATLIGKCHDLTGPWSEPESRRAPFLTAIGPGLLTFSVFQPYNSNVFSLHDTLLDTAEGELPAHERLSYFVAGWYADPTSDILAGTDDLPRLLERLQWTPPVGSGSGIRTSVCTGTVLGLDWELDGPVPDSLCPAPANVTAIVSNSIAEAVAELGAQAEGQGSLSAEEADLFRAFLLGGIDALEERDRPEADILTDRRAHDHAFGPVAGGYRWFIGERGEESGRSTSRAAREAEADTVTDLNRRQAAHDATEAELDAARERLYHLWWLTHLKKKPADFTGRIDGELDPANPDGAAGRVVALARDLAQQRAALPWGRSETDLAARIDALYPAYHSRAARRLIRVPAEDFEYSADPVLTLQGANLHAPLTRDTALPCRTPERLVTAASGVTTTDVAATAVQIDLSGQQPPCFPALLSEFLILDRALASGAIRDVTGTLPEYGTTPWAMPWQPLFLLWKAEYFPLPFRDGDDAHWEFVDGSRYQYNGTGEPGTPLVVSGRQLLAPSAGHIVDGTLQSYARVRDNLSADAVRGVRSQARGADYLSQSLDGFGAAVAQRRPLAGLQPAGDLADLIGNGDYPPPEPGAMPASDWDPWPETTFQELRAGQLAFLDLAVVDRFGRSVNLITNPSHFAPEMPDTMRPAHPVSDYDSGRLVELGPRLLQPARLRFDFLAASTDEDTDLTPGTNPVCAWLLHNRLDKSLVVHAPGGATLGELRVTLDREGEREVSWSALPGSEVTEFEQLETVAPHPYRLLHAVKTRGPQTFDAFRATLDRALETIDPDGPADPGLGFLLGRPLALVRTRLTMNLRGPLRTDVSWQNLFEPGTPQLPTYPWAIRLGEAQQSDDGLVGYVLDDDYEHFESVVDPAAGSGEYLRPIGERPSLALDFGEHSTAVATVLLDPRAAVHATTDILATKKVFVPQEFTDPAIARMAVNFRTGPLLAASTALSGPQGESEETVLMPVPDGIVGTWSWSENRGGTWEKLPVLGQDQYDPLLAEPEIRSGFLTLDDAVAHSRSDN